MDILCGCFEIFRFVLSCGKVDEPETNWSRRYTYSQTTNHDSFAEEDTCTSVTTTQLPFLFREFPIPAASLCSTKLPSSLSSVKLPPPTFKATLPTISQKLTTTQKPKDFPSSSSTSHKVIITKVSPKPKDFLSSLSLPKKQSESSPSPSSCVPNKPDFSTKSTLFEDPTNHNEKTKYVEKGASSTYVTPDHIKGLIENDIVPEVLKKPLSISTYKDYFQALLYAEDHYMEKWDNFEMENVTLELHNAAIYKRRSRNNNLDEDDQRDEKTFVAFELDKVSKKRPFLLSRDFVSLRPSEKKFQIFEGLVYRVVKSNLLLAEFGEDFHSQHRPACKYDVKFSFNRVCLKRAHQAIESVSAHLFRNFLFPEFLVENRFLSKHFFAHNSLDREQNAALDKILRLQASPPYLVNGPISVIDWAVRVRLSKTGNLIVAAVLELYRASPRNRILLCAPVNKTCDLIMRELKKHVAEDDMFRANAAFRERDGVPLDILPSCKYEDKMECFTCPSLDELRRYKIIVSTFMSSYRMQNEGIKAGHFSHIFLMDASSATEPEALVPLANFATEKTVAVITGAPGNRSGLVRSPMAREYDFACSYFERLCDSKLYWNLDPNFITLLKDEHRN